MFRKHTAVLKEASAGKTRSRLAALRGSPMRQAPWKANSVAAVHRHQPQDRAKQHIASSINFGNGGRWLTGSTSSQRAKSSQAGITWSRAAGYCCYRKTTKCRNKYIAFPWEYNHDPKLRRNITCKCGCATKLLQTSADTSCCNQSKKNLCTLAWSARVAGRTNSICSRSSVGWRRAIRGPGSVASPILPRPHRARIYLSLSHRWLQTFGEGRRKVLCKAPGIRFSSLCPATLMLGTVANQTHMPALALT